MSGSNRVFGANKHSLTRAMVLIRFNKNLHDEFDVGNSTPSCNTTYTEHLQSALARLGVDDFDHISAEGLDITVNGTEVL